MGSLSDLSRRLRTLADTLPIRINKMKQQAARAVNKSLLELTPVDTGLAVSNWQVQLDSPASEIRAAFVPTPEGAMKGKKGDQSWTHRADTEVTRQANIGPATELGNATIAEAIPGQPIHITNVLPYIQALDEGHSTQAELFVEKALIFAQDTISQATLI